MRAMARVKKGKGAGEAAKQKVAGGEVAKQVVLGKKKKDEKKVLKVISERNGADPKVSLMTKTQKRNRNRKKKNNKVNGTAAAAPEVKTEESAEAPEVKTEESGIADLNGKPQQSESKNKDKQTDKQPNGDVSSSKAKKKGKGGNKKEEEPASTAAAETEEAATKTTESGETQAPNKKGKKKRKRNKRKASESLEDTEGNAESTQDEEEGSPDKAEGQKKAKKMKVEKKEGEEAAEGEQAKKNKKEKKYVLFMGNLPYQITEEEIREHFKSVIDPIVRVALMKRTKGNKIEGIGKGYGFIEFASNQGYDKALKLNKSKLKDRLINVAFTTPGKNTEKHKAFVENKTQKLLGQKKKKGNYGKKNKGAKKP
ncbi:RNA-binding protein 34 [Chionoecetes opilio]|uniref:RNA-binding protein 34 n=1 Tax=Chionoecetes opilio TaxID=41210 RepID=A0A8J5CZD4_CHIOP|nr:RNA-binding protein 34 [Chionoecetes opilio]